MRQPILKCDAGRQASEDFPLDSANNEEAWFVGSGGKEKSSGWSERRLKIRSALHKGDWKLAMLLYLVLMFFVFTVVFS